MILSKSIEEVLQTAKIEDVVREFVNLKRRGSNLIGLCPFHQEKTPSFNVSPSRNIYKCFGCGKGGDPANFLMEHEKLSFPEAIRWLADRYQIELEETQQSEEAREAQQQRDSLYILNQFAQEWYARQMWETDPGRSIALSYFKRRGFREDTIRAFGLGYAPQGRDTFTRAALEEGFPLEQLKALGLTTEKGYDFFRERVLFPIHHLSGKVAALAGRIMRKEAKAPKYINSKENEVYHKSKVLYGLWHARSAIRKADLCYLVEGYTDVISLHQSGIENTVASSGTSLTEGQTRLIGRFTPNLTILYDGDKAGIQAALRGLDIALEQNLNVKVVLLPEGEDPDSYLQRVGAQAFEDYLQEQARDFIFFKTEVLLEQSGGDPVRRAEVVREVVNSIGRIPDPIKRSVYLKTCARLLDFDEQLLVRELNQQVHKKLKDRHRQKERAAAPTETGTEQPEEPFAPQEAKPATGHSYQEKDIARILVCAGHLPYQDGEPTTVAEFLLSNIEETLNLFEVALYRHIAEVTLDRLKKKLPLSASFFLQHEDKAIRDFAISVQTSPHSYSENWEKRWDISLQTQKMPEHNFSKDSLLAMQRFKLKKVEQLCRENKDRVEALSKEDPEGELITYLHLQKKLLGIRNALAAELGTVVMR